MLGGTYNFGVVKLHLAYETEKSNTINFRDYLVGVSAPVGTGTIMASYIRKDDRTTANNAGGKQYAIGYMHPMSARTNLYTSYGRVSNDAAARFVSGNASDGGAVGQVAGANSTGLTVGIRHKV